MVALPPVNVHIWGKLRESMGGIVPPEFNDWWARKGSKKYPHLHLTGQDDLEPDYKLRWFWNEPHFVRVVIFKQDERIYEHNKKVWGRWGHPLLAAPETRREVPRSVSLIDYSAWLRNLELY